MNSRIIAATVIPLSAFIGLSFPVHAGKERFQRTKPHVYSEAVEQIRSSYLQETWRSHRARLPQQSLTASGGSAKPPIPDCPPKPVIVCLDSWDPIIFDPFE